MQEYNKSYITIDQIIPTAEQMRDRGVALTMIHAYLDKEGNPMVNYDYAIGAVIESYCVTGESLLPTISHIYSEAAAWPEREIAELLPITFTGLDTSQRLFLPEDMLDERGQILVQSMDELKKNK